MSSEHVRILQAKHDTINLADVGTDSTTWIFPTGRRAFLKYIDPNEILLGENGLINSCKKFALAQAILDGLAVTLGGLSIRMLMPNFDLLDRNGAPIRNPRWVQTFYGENRHGFADDYGELIYRTGRNSDNFMKIIIIFGIQDLSDRSKLFTQSIAFGRSILRIISIHDIQRIRNTPDRTLYLHHPILYKKNDDASVFFYADVERMDNIGLLGFVVEPIGKTVAG